MILLESSSLLFAAEADRLPDGIPPLAGIAVARATADDGSGHFIRADRGEDLAVKVDPNVEHQEAYLLKIYRPQFTKAWEILRRKEETHRYQARKTLWPITHDD